MVVWHPGVCLACPSAVRPFNRSLPAWKPTVVIPSSPGSFHQQVFMGCPDKSDLDPPYLPSIGGSPVKPKPHVPTDNTLHGLLLFHQPQHLISTSWTKNASLYLDHPV